MMTNVGLYGQIVYALADLLEERNLLNDFNDSQFDKIATYIWNDINRFKIKMNETELIDHVRGYVQVLTIGIDYGKYLESII